MHSGYGGHGGGIYNSSTMTIASSTVNGNATGAGGDVPPGVPGTPATAAAAAASTTRAATS